MSREIKQSKIEKDGKTVIVNKIDGAIVPNVTTNNTSESSATSSSVAGGTPTTPIPVSTPTVAQPTTTNNNGIPKTKIKDGLVPNITAQSELPEATENTNLPSISSSASTVSGASIPTTDEEIEKKRLRSKFGVYDQNKIKDGIIPLITAAQVNPPNVPPQILPPDVNQFTAFTSALAGIPEPLSIFVPYIGALKDVDLGPQSLSTDVCITAGCLSDGIVTLTGGVFDVFPQTPTAAPFAQYDIANKKYVDDAVSSVDTFLELTDTINSYTNTRILFESGAAVVDSANLTFDGTTLTATSLSDGTATLTSGDLTGLTSLVVDNITIDAATITSDTGTISLNNDNLTTTGAIDCAEISNTLGDLKIEPDIQGNVILFSDTDVASGTTDGNHLIIHRKAAEGDASMDFYVNEFNQGVWSAGAGMVFTQSSGIMSFENQTGNYAHFRCKQGYYFDIYNTTGNDFFVIRDRVGSAERFKVYRQGQIEIPQDNAKMGFGLTTTDLELYSDGTDGHIDTTGDLLISGNITTTGTGTFDDVIVSNLAIDSAVYTDGSSQLTTTAPTSGTIGYWDRTGTILSPANGPGSDDITTSGAIGIGAIARIGNLGSGYIEVYDDANTSTRNFGVSGIYFENAIARLNNSHVRTRTFNSASDIDLQAGNGAAYETVATIQSETGGDPTFDLLKGRLIGDLNGQSYNITTTGIAGASSLDLGVTGATTGVLRMDGSTSGTVTIQPANSAGTYTLTLPTDDGDPDEFLQTNGSGVLTWAAGGGITFGTDNQIPYCNATGDDFDYSADFTFDGSTLTTTGRLSVSSGTLALPGIYFDNDTNTGIYRISENAIGLSAGGVALTWNGGNLELTNGISAFVASASAASAADPAFQMSTHTSGMYRTNDGTSNIQFGTSDLGRLSIDAAGDFDFQAGDIKTSGTITSTDGTAGQSLIASGLVVNNDGNGTDDDDFRAATTSVSTAFVVDASADEILVNVDMQIASDTKKLFFGASDDVSAYYDGTDFILTTDLQNASDFVIDCGANKTLELTEIVWDDLKIVPGAFQFGGSTDPTIRNWQPTGAGTTFKVYKFDKNDEVFATCQMPHMYKEDSDLEFHIHWTPCDRGTAESGSLVGWKVDYTVANVDGTFPVSATVDLSDACTGTDDYHEVTSSVTVSGTGLNVSHILMLRIYRTDTGGDDTWSGTTTQAPALLEFDIHYQKDTMGSRQEYIK